MLHASLGTLFYLREFLPLSCFGDRDLLFLKAASPAPEPDEPLNPLTDAVSYDAFLRADEQSCHSRAHKRLNSRRGQPLKVILRGKHEKADRILDLLENGIFSALSQNLLDAVQITVFADHREPSNVLETYTFSFTYVDSPRDDMTSRLASINLNANGSTTEITASRVSARNGIEMIIRRLITLSFQSAPESQLNDSLCYPEDENWTPETQTCGSADTGHHSVGLKITSMKYRGTNPTLSDSDDGPIEVPTNVVYSKRVPREREIGIDEPNCTSPSLTQQLDIATERKSQETLSATNISQLSTQTRQDQMTKHILQKMILPSTPASDIVPTQVNADDLQTLIADDEEDTQIMRPEISQADLARLAKVQGDTQSDPRHSSTTTGENEVACQCGWKEKASNEKMLCCSFCNKLQHPICYGFLHGKDPSIPATHSCYQCLLDPVAEVHTLRELSTLAMLRQALKVIVERGYPNRVSEFGTMLRKLRLPFPIAKLNRLFKDLGSMLR
ncbi:DNA binding protein [Ascosphaera pollenicola]|nr:DNA binding protein [Ascosphaera pollenicola]